MDVVGAVRERTEVVNICDQQSMEDGQIVRRRTIITLGPTGPNGHGDKSSSHRPFCTHDHSAPTVKSGPDAILGRSQSSRTGDSAAVSDGPILYVRPSVQETSKAGPNWPSLGCDIEMDARPADLDTDHWPIRPLKKDPSWYRRRQTYGFEASHDTKLQNMWNTMSRSCDNSAANNWGQIVPPWINMAPNGRSDVFSPSVSATSKGRSAGDLRLAGSETAAFSSHYWTKTAPQAEPAWLRELKTKKGLREQRWTADAKTAAESNPWNGVKLKPAVLEVAQDETGISADFLRRLKTGDLMRIVEESPPVSSDFTALNGSNERAAKEVTAPLKSPAIVSEIANLDSSKTAALTPTVPPTSDVSSVPKRRPNWPPRSNSAAAADSERKWSVHMRIQSLESSRSHSTSPESESDGVRTNSAASKTSKTGATLTVPDDAVRAKDMGYHSMERENGRRKMAAALTNSAADQVQLDVECRKVLQSVSALENATKRPAPGSDATKRTPSSDATKRTPSSDVGKVASDQSDKIGLTGGMAKERAAELVRHFFDTSKLAPAAVTSRAGQPIRAAEDVAPTNQSRCSSAPSLDDISNCDLSFDELFQLCGTESSDVGSDWEHFFQSDEEENAAGAGAVAGGAPSGVLSNPTPNSAAAAAEDKSLECRRRPASKIPVAVRPCSSAKMAPQVVVKSDQSRTPATPTPSGRSSRSRSGSRIPTRMADPFGRNKADSPLEPTALKPKLAHSKSVDPLKGSRTFQQLHRRGKSDLSMKRATTEDQFYV